MVKKAPNPIDRHVGSRVRMRRLMLGMSQEKLGDGLGLTFQQVQKYEKGTNRIGASRLQHIARCCRCRYHSSSMARRRGRTAGRRSRRLFSRLCVRFPRHL